MVKILKAYQNLLFVKAVKLFLAITLAFIGTSTTVLCYSANSHAKLEAKGSCECPGDIEASSPSKPRFFEKQDTASASEACLDLPSKNDLRRPQVENDLNLGACPVWVTLYSFKDSSLYFGQVRERPRETEVLQYLSTPAFLSVFRI